MVRALEAVLGRPINVSPEGHFMGALGAALFALERARPAIARSQAPERAGIERSEAPERAGEAREPASSTAGEAREPASSTAGEAREPASSKT
jgi:hypothetical protein